MMGLQSTFNAPKTLNLKQTDLKQDIERIEHSILSQYLNRVINNYNKVEPLDGPAILTISINYSQLTSFLNQIDFNVLHKFIKDIEEGIFPLEDQKISFALFHRTKKPEHGAFAYWNNSHDYYVPAARALRLDDIEFLKKLAQYERDANDYRDRQIWETADRVLEPEQKKDSTEKRHTLNYKPLKPGEFGPFGPDSCKDVKVVTYENNGYTCSNCKISFSALEDIANHLGKLPKLPTEDNPNPEVKIVESL